MSHLVIEESADARVEKLFIIAHVHTDSLQIFTAEQSRDTNQFGTIVISDVIHVAYHA